MDLEEVVTGTERIYEGKVVNLRVDSVRLPSGKASKREVVEHNAAACVVPMRDRETVILIRQWRLPSGKALLEIPAGSVDPGESAQEAAARELIEEIGEKPGRLLPLYEAFLAPGYSTERMYAYLALDLSPAKSDADTGETIDLVEMPLKDALASIGTAGMEDAKTIAALLVADRVLKSL